MSFDGFFIHHLVKELNAALQGARLEKITMSDASTFLLQLYRRGTRSKLLISTEASGFGAYLTNKAYPNMPGGQFHGQLKKHLEGGLIARIHQHQTDRVIIIDVNINDMIDGIITKSLVFEAMGRHSNLILVESGKIIDCQKKMFSEDRRQLLPQADFEFFPSDKKPFTSLSYDDIYDQKDLTERYMGISPLLARYLFAHQPDILSIPIQPTIDLTDHKFYAFDLFDASHEKRYVETLSELLDGFQPKATTKTNPQLVFIEREIKKAERKLEYQKKDLDQAHEDLTSKEIADGIYQSGLDLKMKVSEIHVADKTIVLDPQYTLNEHAQNYYKSYRKAKRAIDHLKHAIQAQILHLHDLKDLHSDIELSKDTQSDEMDDILNAYGYHQQKPTSKKKPTTPNIKSITYEGITIYIGTNSLQNQYVTHSLASKNDYWFHVKDAPGSHVIAKTDRLNESILRTCAMLAAYFSKLKESQSIPVDYTQVKYLKKIPKTPRYQVAYTDHKTIYIDIDKKRIEALLSEKLLK